MYIHSLDENRSRMRESLLDAAPLLCVLARRAGVQNGTGSGQAESGHRDGVLFGYGRDGGLREEAAQVPVRMGKFDSMLNVFGV